MDITRLNYDELKIISKKLHDEGEDYAQLHSATRQKLTGLRSEWEGDAADKFFDEMEAVVLPATKRLSQALIHAQDVLNNIVKIIAEADEETASIFKNGDDFGAAAFGSALGAGAAGAVGIAAGGDDFGAGAFQSAGNAGTPGAGQGAAGEQGAGPAGENAGTGSAPAAPTTSETSTTEEAAAPTEAPPAAGGGGGGGGGGASSSGIQGDLKGMGLGLGGQPAGSSAAGGSAGGAESLPDHVFGGSGGSGGQAPLGGSSGSGAGEAPPSGGDGGVAAGIAGVVGSAAIGGAAKVLKDKASNE